MGSMDRRLLADAVKLYVAGRTEARGRLVPIAPSAALSVSKFFFIPRRARQIIH